MVIDNQDRFAREREEVMRAARKGIASNIPLQRIQKKYLKNLLLYSMMNATNNETVTNRNFIKLVNRLFKKFLTKIVVHNSDTDEDDADEGLDVDLNSIVAKEANLDLQQLQQILTPEKIMAIIKLNTNGVSQKMILDRLIAARDLRANHRETPEEQKEREKREKEYELQRKMQRAMEMMNGRGGIEH